VRGDPRTTRCPLAARSVSSPPFVAKGWGDNTTGTAGADNFVCFSAIGERGEWVSGRNGGERNGLLASFRWLLRKRLPPLHLPHKGEVKRASSRSASVAPPSSGLRPPSPIEGEGASTRIESSRSSDVIPGLTRDPLHRLRELGPAFAGMTGGRWLRRRHPLVMAGLDPATQRDLRRGAFGWVPGSSPGMTTEGPVEGAPRLPRRATVPREERGGRGVIGPSANPCRLFRSRAARRRRCWR
jgi:hypothetical protein